LSRSSYATRYFFSISTEDFTGALRWPSNMIIPVIENWCFLN
jgi:hypothetical protein